MNFGKRRWVFCLGILLLAQVFVSAVALADIGVSTLGMDIRVAPGDTKTGTFVITNGNDFEAHVVIEIADFDRNDQGAVDVLPANSTSRSLANYISLPFAEFTIEAGVGSTREIRFTIDMPSSASGAHWAMILVREVTSEDGSGDSQGDQGSAQGQLSLQFGIQIRQEDPTIAASDGRITNIDVQMSESGQASNVLIDYENLGNTFQKPSGEVRIVNEAGEVVASIAIREFRMLPGGSRQLLVPLELNLPPGDYVALAILDFGGDFLLAGQSRFRVS
jgi:hypothetical protein